MRRLLNVRPRGGGRFFLGFIPLVAVLLLYLSASGQRLAENPNDKLLPSPAAMTEAVQMMARVDPMTDRTPLLADTAASLRRLGAGLVVATAITLVLGLVIGLLPVVRAGLGPLVSAIA
ncbi:MAG: ABC transporter permease, partial [Phenylobacterium sp.]